MKKYILDKIHQTRIWMNYNNWKNNVEVLSDEEYESIHIKLNIII